MDFKVSLIGTKEANKFLEAAGSEKRIKNVDKVLHIAIADAEGAGLAGAQMQLDDLLRNGHYLDKGFKPIPVHAIFNGPNGKPLSAIIEAHPKIVSALQTQMFITGAETKSLMKALSNAPGKG